MTRRNDRRALRQARRKEQLTALLNQQGFLDWVVEVLDYLEPGDIFVPNTQQMANRATRADVAKWIVDQLSAIDANSAWVLERERMRRRRDFNGGTGSGPEGRRDSDPTDDAEGDSLDDRDRDD